ncbi:hypothetical protein [Desertihabitans aurantiacus]|uniref:hypothetical protein n=1 Tax=Desertihabitans aurantiacus TaxID=2282477 RepID=UPI000DF7C8FD|nr:hypothetical protein [Desertihabitans aurantiacus]
MRRPAPLPAGFCDGAFRTATALAHGIGPERLRRQDLAHPFHGINAPAALELDGCTLIRLRALALTDEHWFTHTSAAQLHGLWLPPRLRDDPTVHVTCEDQRHRRGGRGVRSHVALPGTDVVVRVRGLPAQSPADVWATLATTLDRTELITLGDHLVRRRDPWCTLADLDAARRRRRGRRGARAMTEALDWVRPGTDSVMETELRLQLLSWAFPESRVNIWVHDDRRRFLARCDLVWEQYRVVAEYEGDHHRTDPVQWDQDISRADRLSDEDWSVVRVTVRQLRREPDALRARFVRALTRGGWRP